MPIRIVPDFEREGEAENPIVVFSLLGLIVGFFLFVVRGRRGEDDGRARRAPESMNERSARAFETWAPSSPPPGGARAALSRVESRETARVAVPRAHARTRAGAAAAILSSGLPAGAGRKGGGRRRKKERVGLRLSSGVEPPRARAARARFK